MTNKQAGLWRERGYGGIPLAPLRAISHLKLSQSAFRGNPPVSLVPFVSLLVGFPDIYIYIYIYIYISFNTLC